MNATLKLRPRRWLPVAAVACAASVANLILDPGPLTITTLFLLIACFTFAAVMRIQVQEETIQFVFPKLIPSRRVRPFNLGALRRVRLSRRIPFLGQHLFLRDRENNSLLVSDDWQGWDSLVELVATRALAQDAQMSPETRKRLESRAERFLNTGGG